MDIVQDTLFDGPPVYAKLCVDCQTARQRNRRPWARSAATTSMAHRALSWCNSAANTLHNIARARESRAAL